MVCYSLVTIGVVNYYMTFTSHIFKNSNIVFQMIFYHECAELALKDFLYRQRHYFLDFFSWEINELFIDRWKRQRNTLLVYIFNKDIFT